MLTIGEKIRYFRQHRLMTQAELAERSGIHPVSIRKYETNKMHPQPAQIERLAAALNVSAGALSGTYQEMSQLKTKGDLMGLLITWHKAGILRIEGTRSDGKHLDMDSVHLVLHPLLQKYMTLIWTKAGLEGAGDSEEELPLEDWADQWMGDWTAEQVDEFIEQKKKESREKKQKIIPWDDLKIKIDDCPDLQTLIRWESSYYGCLELEKMYGETDSKPIAETLQEIKDTVEVIEMELRGSPELLR